MFALKDLVDLMDRWDAWKTLKEQAGKVPELERRVAELENLLNGKAPADFCRKCGERAARVVGNPALNKNLVQEHWFCAACNCRDIRFSKP